MKTKRKEIATRERMQADHILLTRGEFNRLYDMVCDRRDASLPTSRARAFWAKQVAWVKGIAKKNGHR